MSETGDNNSNFNQAVNNSPNSLQNSQNPESYGNQSNSMNPYNSGYNSGYGGGGYGGGYGSSGYGGYGSSYGSSFGSGYGSSYGSSYGSGYGSGYGSSYGTSGYGASGYSSYGGGMNQYSNTYSKPMQQGQQGQQNQQVPPPNLRHDVWGFLNGFHAILNVLYAGTGIVHFGKMFFKMSIKIIKAVFGKSAGLVYKLTGFQFLKNIMQKLSNKGDWLGEFNPGEAPLENLWSNNGPESANTNRTFFGKFMLVLRILSLMGGIVSFFLRRKVSSASQNQQPPVQIEFIDHEIPQVQLKPDVGIEGIKSFYDEVKLIEQDHAEELRDTVSMKEIIEEVNEEAKSEVEIKEESPKSVIISEVEEKTLEKLNEDETNPIAVVSNIIEEVPVAMPSQEIFVPQVLESQETVTIQTVPETTTTTQVTKEQIVSEDFWKNEEVFKKIESIQKETETKPFELPSVLKTLKPSSSTATKPWLMKKKKNPEPAQEVPVQTLIESAAATLPTETITPEMPDVKKENSEVVEIPNTIENPLEGTA